jgi:hypothetical protein
MKHEGFHKNRLVPKADNPREIAFAGMWMQEQDCGPCSRSLIEVLISNCTQRDATVAATVVQWMGSGVGMCFLCDVINASPDVKRYVSDRCGLKRNHVRSPKGRATAGIKILREHESKMVDENNSGVQPDVGGKDLC